MNLVVVVYDHYDQMQSRAGNEKKNKLNELLNVISILCYSNGCILTYILIQVTNDEIKRFRWLRYFISNRCYKNTIYYNI